MAELRDKALAAVEEAAGAAADQHQVVPRSLSLRFALAFLANFSDDRSPFDDLWQAITRPAMDDSLAAGFGRRQAITSNMNGLYRAVGVRRRWEERGFG